MRKELQSKLKKGDQSAGVLEGLEQEIAAVSNEVAKEQKLLREISDTLGQANELRSMTEVLDRRWEKANEQASSFYESISLGLTAEALSHEIHHIANRLARRSSDLLRQIRAGTTTSGRPDCFHRGGEVEHCGDAQAARAPHAVAALPARAKGADQRGGVHW